MMNSTSYQYPHESGTFFVLMLTILAVLAPFIITGNLFVVLAVYKNYNLRTPTNFILTSLAMNDMVTSVALALDSYPSAFGSYTWYPDTARLLSLPLFTSCACTVLHIATLTVDRYVAVTKPLEYPTLITQKRVGYAVASIWTIGLIIAGIRGYMALYEEPKVIGSEGGKRYSLWFAVYSWFIVSALIIILLVSVVSNLRILQIAVKQARAIANEIRSGQNNRIEPETIERRLKAVKTTGIIIGVLVLFWAPYIVLFALQVTRLEDNAFMVPLNLGFQVSVAIAAALNPFIYHYRDREFRDAFLKIFQAASNKFVC